MSKQKFTYPLYLEIVELGPNYTIREVSLAMLDDGTFVAGPQGAEEKFKQYFTESIEAKSLAEWGVGSVAELFDKCTELNEEEMSRAETDLTIVRSQIKKMPSSPDLGMIADHLERVVGRYIRWFKGNNLELPPEAGALDTGNAFIRSGEVWSIKYRGSEPILVKNLRGIRHVTQLLRQPSDSVHCNEFYVGEVDEAHAAEAMDAQLSKRTGEMEEPVLDERAIVEIQNKLKHLLAEREKAKSSGQPDSSIIIEECTREIEQLASYLKAHGSGKAPISKSLKRKSDAIRKAIHEAIERIEEQNAELAAHLRSTIQTGSWLQYHPGEEIVWQIVE